MCGRFYFNFDDSAESVFLKKVLQQVSIVQFAQQEVFPKQEILLLCEVDGKLSAKKRQWGKAMQNDLLINARSETYQTKKTFQTMQRCAIPCNYFFEWKQVGKTKVKHSIKKQSQSIIYLAALYDEQSVVILTGEASKAMATIHHRTPLIMDHTTMLRYLNNEMEACVDNDNLLIQSLVAHEQTSLFAEE